MEKRLFTSESVTEGHPDKVCDAISDAILDACMEKDPMSRVACETAVCTGFVLVTGEITTNAYVDMQKIVRDTVKEIGYTKSEYGFDGNTCAVLVAIDEQSADIAMGVDKALEAKENKMSDEEIEAIGAGDQGMMFGYATNETEEYMPYPISLAHKLALQLTKVRKDGTLSYLRPDGKSQVSVEYDENGKPVRLEAVVLSTQHDPDVTQEQIHEDIKKYVFDPILPKHLLDENTKYFINPTGRFVIGGPHGDAGLTGREYHTEHIHDGRAHVHTRAVHAHCGNGDGGKDKPQSCTGVPVRAANTGYNHWHTDEQNIPAVQGHACQVRCHECKRAGEPDGYPRGQGIRARGLRGRALHVFCKRGEGLSGKGRKTAGCCWHPDGTRCCARWQSR